eukprot:jgi/Mesen1/3479/ME000195S02626
MAPWHARLQNPKCLFIPYSFIEKEASHVEGFSPELALVTIGGGKELEERLVVSLGDKGTCARMLDSCLAMQMIGVYREFATEHAAIPVIAGRKSPNETFAGAVRTYTIEAMMGDRKALQAGTSHNLGQNFAKAFETQVAVVPIWKKDTEKEAVMAAAAAVGATLKQAGIRVKVDSSDQKTPGWKYNFWEMKGVPIRIEIGPRDVASNTVVTARRDKPGKEGKEFGIPMEAEPLVAHLRTRLDEIQANMLAIATAFRDSNIVDVTSYDDLKAAILDGNNEDEKRIKDDTMATLRCVPFEQPPGRKTCFMTGEPAQEVALFAKAY